MSIILDPAALRECLAGGLVIGTATAALLLLNGRVAGISGIFYGLSGRGWQGWRAGFILGLLAAGAGAALLGVKAPAALAATPLWLLALAGLLVGFGTKLGNGCTSGHGVCGMARLSPRSGAAVLCFMGIAMLTVFLVRHVL